MNRFSRYAVYFSPPEDSELSKFASSWLGWDAQNVKKISKYFHLELNQLKKEFPKVIKEVRGVGLLIGLQLHSDQTNFIQKLMDHKLLTIRAAENVIRILPPLTVKVKEIDVAIKIIKKVCKEYKI